MPAPVALIAVLQVAHEMALGRIVRSANLAIYPTSLFIQDRQWCVEMLEHEYDELANARVRDSQ